MCHTEILYFPYVHLIYASDTVVSVVASQQKHCWFDPRCWDYLFMMIRQ